MKLICIVGPANTGKSTAVRSILENRSRLSKQSGEVTAIVLISKRTAKKQPVGFASDGDFPHIIRKNFEFLTKFNGLSAIVCAIRDEPGALKEFQRWSRKLKARPIVIGTSKLPKSQQAKALQSIVKEIAAKIR